MQISKSRGLVSVAACVLAAALFMVLAGRASAVPPPISVVPVSFSVINEDASLVPCATDGQRYTISGSLILPRGVTPSGVTLYAHGLGFDSDFWDFSAVTGYDYAAQEAAQGHASVVIDRLGYGTSGKPQGDASCLGGQATILHEIVGDLRSGDYTADSASAPTFSRIGLVGHSVGGEIAEIEAYSFKDVDALGVMDFDDGDYSPAAYSAFGADTAACALGGQAQSAGGPGGYGAFGTSAAAYDRLFFHDADPAVESAATAERTLDPCGDVLSVVSAAATSLTHDGSIAVPVAFVWGQDDALFPKALPWAQLQEALYTASPKVTNIELPDSGHAVTLERSEPQLEAQMSSWLSANGL